MVYGTSHGPQDDIGNSLDPCTILYAHILLLRTRKIRVVSDRALRRNLERIYIWFDAEGVGLT